MTTFFPLYLRTWIAKDLSIPITSVTSLKHQSQAAKFRPVSELRPASRQALRQSCHSVSRKPGHTARRPGTRRPRPAALTWGRWGWTRRRCPRRAPCCGSLCQHCRARGAKPPWSARWPRPPSATRPGRTGSTQSWTQTAQEGDTQGTWRLRPCLWVWGDLPCTYTGGVADSDHSLGGLTPVPIRRSSQRGPAHSQEIFPLAISLSPRSAATSPFEEPRRAAEFSLSNYKFGLGYSQNFHNPVMEVDWNHFLKTWNIKAGVPWRFIGT